MEVGYIAAAEGAWADGDCRGVALLSRVGLLEAAMALTCHSKVVLIQCVLCSCCITGHCVHTTGRLLDREAVLFGSVFVCAGSDVLTANTSHQ